MSDQADDAADQLSTVSSDGLSLQAIKLYIHLDSRRIKPGNQRYVGAVYDFLRHNKITINLQPEGKLPELGYRGIEPTDLL